MYPSKMLKNRNSAKFMNYQVFLTGYGIQKTFTEYYGLVYDLQDLQERIAPKHLTQNDNCKNDWNAKICSC